MAKRIRFFFQLRMVVVAAGAEDHLRGRHEREKVIAIMRSFFENHKRIAFPLWCLRQSTGTASIFIYSIFMFMKNYFK